MPYGLISAPILSLLFPRESCETLRPLHCSGTGERCSNFDIIVCVDCEDGVMHMVVVSPMNLTYIRQWLYQVKKCFLLCSQGLHRLRNRKVPYLGQLPEGSDSS